MESFIRRGLPLPARGGKICRRGKETLLRERETCRRKEEFGRREKEIARRVEESSPRERETCRRRRDGRHGGPPQASVYEGWELFFKKISRFWNFTCNYM